MAQVLLFFFFLNRLLQPWQYHVLFFVWNDYSSELRCFCGNQSCSSDSWARWASASKQGTAVMRRGWGCNSGRFCRNLMSGPHFIRLLWGLFLWARWLALPHKVTTYILWFGLKGLGWVFWPALQHTCLLVTIRIHRIVYISRCVGRTKRCMLISEMSFFFSFSLGS